jgi:YD repeat-containing protein
MGDKTNYNYDKLDHVTEAISSTRGVTDNNGQFEVTLTVRDLAAPLTVFGRSATPGSGGYTGLTTTLTSVLSRDLYSGTRNTVLGPLNLSPIPVAELVEVQNKAMMVKNTLLPDVALYVGSNSLVDAAGKATKAAISLTEIPLDHALANLPINASPDFLISVQTDGDADLKTLSSHALGNTISVYDEVGNLVSMTDRVGRTTTYGYDQLNRQEKVKDWAGGETLFGYDYDFDALNRQQIVTDARGGKTVYDYYKDGKTKSITDSVGNVTSYTYDAVNRIKTEINPLGTRSYDYFDSPLNYGSMMVDRNGRATVYRYDSLDRTVSEQWFAGAVPLSPQKQFTYTYDKNGNVLTAGDGSIDYSYQYDKTNLLEKVDRVGGGLPKISLEYFYDEIGNLTQADEYVAGQLNASTIYKYEDDRYLNTSIIQSRPGLAKKKVVFEYDEFGQNKGVERFVGDVLAVNTTNSYDEFGRLVGIEHVNGLGAVIGSSSYVFDDLDRLTKETRDGVSREFDYDAIDQVKTVSGSNTEAYDYDLNGNRLNYTLDSANRVVFDGVYRYTYDNEGNRTKRVKVDSGITDVYEWDNRNRLITITTSDSVGLVIQAVAYEYDVDDQRVSKRVVTAQGQIVERYSIETKSPLLLMNRATRLSTISMA